MGVGIGGGSWGGGRVGIGVNFPIGGTAVYPSQRVDVLLRDLANGQVVVQSQASGNSGASAATLLEAALRDFPNGAARHAVGAAVGAGWVLKPYARLPATLVECQHRGVRHPASTQAEGLSS